MNRIAEMEEYIMGYRSKRMEEKRQSLRDKRGALLQSLVNRLTTLSREQSDRQRNGEQDKIKYILLFRLLSSGYTGSGEIGIGMSNALLYLDENASRDYWKPPAVYDDVESAVKDAGKILRQKYVRLEEYELLRLKQKLLRDDWELFVGLVGDMTAEIAAGVMACPLQLENKIEILCGDYMDRLDRVGSFSATEGKEGQDGWKKEFFSHGGRV